MTSTDQSGVSLADALEREHHEIDAGIEAFLAGEPAAASLLPALTALRRHIYLEEEFLFPPLRGAGLMVPLMVMVREHGALWDAMDVLESRLGGAEDDTAAACRELLSLLESHNAKEEPVIYSRADPVLTGEAADALHGFLATGRTPEGWVCERATR